MGFNRENCCREGCECGFSFIGLIWFSQTLGVGNLGMYFLFLALVGVSELFADMGINGAVEKRISQGEPVPETVYAALPLKLLLFTLVTATVLYLSPIINPYIGVEVAYLIPVTILLKNISDLLRRSLNGDMRVEETAYMIGVEQLGWVLFGTLFAQVGTESFALIHGYIAALVIVVTIGLVKVPLAPVKPDKREQHHFFSTENMTLYQRQDGECITGQMSLLRAFS